MSKVEYSICDQCGRGMGEGATCNTAGAHDVSVRTAAGYWEVDGHDACNHKLGDLCVPCLSAIESAILHTVNAFRLARRQVDEPGNTKRGTIVVESANRPD